MAELVKAMAWPIAAVTIALTFRGGLLAGLPSFVRRTIELEGFGLKAKIDAAEQQKAGGENPATEKLPEKAALDPSPGLTVNIIETQLHDELKGIEAGKREPVLVRALAQSRLVRWSRIHIQPYIREPDFSAKAVERS